MKIVFYDYEDQGRGLLTYCEYLARTIAGKLRANDAGLLNFVGKPEPDLDSEGYLESNKRTILVTDLDGVRYRITVEEV
jgi:hypothetical protein